MDFVNRLAGEFKLRPQQVQAAVELLDAGNTIPFIARYRKEATGRFPLLHGTGRKRQARWMTRCCGRWQNGWNTCGTWKSAGRKLLLPWKNRAS